MTIEEFVGNQKVILDAYIERVVGSYTDSSEYYHRVLEEMAKGFYSGLLSPDDVSLIAENTLTQAGRTQKSFENLPSEFAMLVEVEWYLRNDPHRAASLLLDLREFLPK